MKSPAVGSLNRKAPMSGPSTTSTAMAGMVITEVASMALWMRRLDSPVFFRAVLSASLGTSTRPKAPMKAVGR